MRLFLVALVAAVSSVATAATAPRVTTGSPIAVVAADGRFVAFGTTPPAPRCERVFVWRTSPRRVFAFPTRSNCPGTSTGRGFAGLAIAGNRALWITYTGGNIREWSLWTASTTRRTPRQLAFETRDVDAPQPVLVGNGDTSRFGDLLPYAVDRTVVVLRSNGSRAFTWTAEGRVLALSTKDGEVAIAYTGGWVAILTAAGRVLRAHSMPADVTAVSVTGNGVVGQYGRTLEYRNPARYVVTVPAGMRLDDADGARAVVSGRGSVRVLSLTTGATLASYAGTRATIEGRDVYVANGRRVVRYTVR